jgi:hypothetical protein
MYPNQSTVLHLRSTVDGQPSNKHMLQSQMDQHTTSSSRLGSSMLLTIILVALLASGAMQTAASPLKAQSTDPPKGSAQVHTHHQHATKVRCTI